MSKKKKKDNIDFDMEYSTPDAYRNMSAWQPEQKEKTKTNESTKKDSQN